MKRRDFLKAGIGGAFALWGLAGAMQEAKAWAAKGRESLPRGRKIDIHAGALSAYPSGGSALRLFPALYETAGQGDVCHAGRYADDAAGGYGSRYAAALL